MRALLFLALLFSLLFSSEIKEPIRSFTSSGGVVDLLYKNGKLYSATNASCVDIFDYKSGELIKKIKVEKIEDFMGDLVDSKVYSVDLFDEKILVLSQDRQGFRRVHIHQDEKSKLLFDYSKSLTVSKARFLDENTILLGLLSNELVSYDINKGSINWMIQVSGAKFSDFVLSETKEIVVVADESGDLKIHSTKDGKRLKLLSGQNLDNVFQVDYKNSVIATAGQDRRAVIYDLKSDSSHYFESGFLIYSVGLSPSGRVVGYASDEENNISLVDLSTKELLGIFGGNKMTLTKIVFVDESEFLAASDDRVINLYSVK
ncbi:WD40 repeat domain-containing protein [Sulfurimonas crateris]|uniref:WD40 repeat domain-containing protein n=1 Tax=Sulfurimonas crateris TaxID=2574727 RepID=A0A4U2Z608_9BACT|nr:PQQ-binding-like beta-propeller repeat protein [Sulfurimonas crateris]TKI69275.1 WD40 repeat domain-containing protein [Sulfurimonas crateris]